MDKLRIRDQLVEEGFLAKSTRGSLTLYNYTAKAQYERNWSPTVLASRGIVFDSATGECVAYPFPKFFNLDEHETTKRENLPSEPYTAFEKLDGSLGILYRYQGQFCVTTRGSLHSEQGAFATEMLGLYDMGCVDDDLTLLFEIIYPENLIVIPYGDRRELVLLGAYNRHTGEEQTWRTLLFLSEATGMPLPKIYHGSFAQMLTAREEIPYTEEGWVLRYASGLRVKVKGSDYLRLHKIKACMGPLAIWEAMVAGQISAYLQELPEEMRKEAEAVYAKLESQQCELVAQAHSFISRTSIAPVDIRDKLAVKETACKIQKAPEVLRAYLFQYMRGEIRPELLLSQIRPDANTYVEVPHG